MSTLVEAAPSNPLPLAAAWLDEAEAGGSRRNPLAMALATADANGRPAVRMVLLKSLSATDGFALFYSNYDSRKGRELSHNARAAGVLYWDDLGRQLRLEGPVVKSPAEESDAYFRTRPPGSQLNAWASAQSQPLTEPGELRRKIDRLAAEPGHRRAERPPYWGGYRLWIEALEFWIAGEDRFHERLRYERELHASAAGAFDAGAWTYQCLQP